jgi:hypothetical protein
LSRLVLLALAGGSFEDAKLPRVFANGAQQSRDDQPGYNQRAAASAVSSGRVLNAMHALGAALRTVLNCGRGKDGVDFSILCRLFQH